MKATSMGCIVVIACALALICNAAELRAQDYDESADDQMAEQASNESIDQISIDSYNTAVSSSSLPVITRKISSVFIFGQGKVPSVKVTPQKWIQFYLIDWMNETATWWTNVEDPYNPFNSWMLNPVNSSWLTRKIRYEATSVKTVNVDVNPQLKADFIISGNVPNPDMYTDDGCLSRNGAKAIFRHMPNNKQVSSPNINVYFVHCVDNFNTGGLTDNNFWNQEPRPCWEYPASGNLFYNSSIISDLPWENTNDDIFYNLKIMHTLVHEEGHAQRFFHPLYGCPVSPVPENYCTNLINNDPNLMGYMKYFYEIVPLQQENIYKILPATSPDELP
jgi:hypothetical protein